LSKGANDGTLKKFPILIGFDPEAVLFRWSLLRIVKEFLESQINVSRNRLNLQIYWFIRIISKRWKIYRQVAVQGWFCLAARILGWRTPLYHETKSEKKTEKRYSDCDDFVHLGDAGNILLQDMVGGLVNHLSNLNKRSSNAWVLDTDCW